MIYIMRGLPGCGKTFWVQNNLTNRKYVVSADSFHMKDGVYQYDPKNATFAHSECLRQFIDTIKDGFGHTSSEGIFVDNTNTSLVELAPYVRVSEAFGVKYCIVYLMCSVETAIKRNVHAVPANTILAMHKNLLTEIVPPYWNQEVVLP